MGRRNAMQQKAFLARSKKVNKIDQQNHLSEDEKNKVINNDIKYPKIKAPAFWAGSILTGGTYTQDSEKCDLWGIPHEGQTKYYEAQKKFGDKIINLAKSSCKESLINSQKPLDLSCDASYDHRRNGSWCTCYVTNKDKVVGFNTLGNVGGK